MKELDDYFRDVFMKNPKNAKVLTIVSIAGVCIEAIIIVLMYHHF